MYTYFIVSPLSFLSNNSRESHKSFDFRNIVILQLTVDEDYLCLMRNYLTHSIDFTSNSPLKTISQPGLISWLIFSFFFLRKKIILILGIQFFFQFFSEFFTYHKRSFLMNFFNSISLSQNLFNCASQREKNIRNFRTRFEIVMGWKISASNLSDEWNWTECYEAMRCCKEIIFSLFLIFFILLIYSRLLVNVYMYVKICFILLQARSGWQWWWWWWL